MKAGDESPFRRWAWSCPIVAIAVSIAVITFFDLSLWNAVLVALLLVCPAVILWGVIVTRQPISRRDAK